MRRHAFDRVAGLASAAVMVAGLGTLGLGVTAVTAIEAHAAAAGVTLQSLDSQVLSSLPSVATLVGPTAGATPLSLDVAIDSQLSAKEAAVQSIYTPGSADYHRYFTNASWAARFGVPDSVWQPVVAYFRSFGMTVGYADPEHDLVELHATVAQADQALQITEQDWTLTSDGGTFHTNDVAPTVPVGVDAVEGLDDAGFVEKGAKDTDQQVCNPDPSGGDICTGGFEGPELRTIYDVGTTDIGTGQALAVNGDGDTQGPTADLHKYESDRGLPAVNTVFVNTDSDDCVASGPEPSDCDTSGEGEWALDSTSSTAMAPGVKTLYYFFPSDLGDDTSFQAWVDYTPPAGDPVPMQQNASWGECETLAANFVPVSDGSYTPYTQAFVDAAGKGKTQFVSAGDTGSGCLPGVNGVSTTEPPDIEWPCASQWVVCVGGTVVYSNGATDATEQRADEGGTCTPQTTIGELNFCGEEAWSHTGGGSSVYIPAQRWQTALPGIALPERCELTPKGEPDTGTVPCRGVPDVDALSGDITVVVNGVVDGVSGNGFFDVEGGTPQTATQPSPEPGTESEDGGTSLSDPLWEGMWADINSSSPTGTWGFAAPALYQIGETPAEDTCAFYDVQLDQAGSNFTYPAEPRTAEDPVGWDYVSGLGTPDVACIEAELAAGTTTPPASTPEAPTPLLLLVPGVGAAAWLVHRRRRRHAS